MKPIEIILVDDHISFLAGTFQILNRTSNFKIVAVAADGPTAVMLVKEHHPDVVVMDVGLPDAKDGIEATRQIASTMNSVKILALSGYYKDKTTIKSMLDAGATGYVEKTCDFSEIRRAIREVAKNHIYLCAATALTLAKENTDTKLSDLTARETEILALLSEGFSTKEIAFDLEISVNTVYTYLARIKETLKLSSIADLIRFAVINNLSSSSLSSDRRLTS